MAGLARVALLLPGALQAHSRQVLPPGRRGQPLRLLNRPARARGAGRQTPSPRLLVTAVQAASGLAARGAVGCSP